MSLSDNPKLKNLKKKNKYDHTTFDLNYVSKDTFFSFRGEKGGDSCRNIKPQDRVLITAVDLYRLAKQLNMSVQDVAEQYCDMIPGQESMIPLLVMKSRMDGSCRCLKNGICSAGKARPLTCLVNPLARLLFRSEETEEQYFQYYLPEDEENKNSDAAPVMKKVQDFLDEIEIEEYDGCVILYKKLGAVCSKLMHEAKDDAQRREMFMTAFFLMYAKYDTNVDLRSQLEMNLAFIQSLNPKTIFDPSKLV